MGTRAKSINSWLENEQSGDNILAIFGMGGEKRARISSVSEGTRKVEEALQVKRVLIVIDDIDDHDQLDALLGTWVSHTQSKIIITTRLLDIRAWFRSISWECEVQKSELLNDEESLQLLIWDAFGSKIRMEGFKDLGIQVAQYCGGNPLALKVLGSSLFFDAEESRSKNSMTEVWRSTLNSLNSLKGDLDCKIQDILQKSFDSLPYASNKELFLHIAFFFVGEYEGYVVKIMENDWHAKARIRTLINRCLLTVSPSKKLMMHQLLQEMARNIVLQESKDPAARSRVLQNDESYRLLTKGEGSKTIEGLSLDMQKLKEGMMSNVLNSMKILNLKGSFDLVSIHHLSRLPNLETLILSHCINLSLTHVCEIIGGLKKLSLLDFGWCNHLGKVASNKYEDQPLVPYPDSLKILFLNDWNIDGIDDDPLFLIEELPFFYNHMNLVSNSLMLLTNYTYYEMLRVFDVLYEYGIMSTYLQGIKAQSLPTSECGVSLDFIDDGEEELKYNKNYKKEEEVIGGDLSEFELTTGAYYLCRRDYFKSTTPDWLNILFGDTISHKGKFLFELMLSSRLSSKY
ncbi:unnamed protein product [Lactuca saligna]|uniref:NB-ARC domain-containing protein n=1 Tax=Lactuca saligna TaxID=75948 RepID=A0AA35ZIU2_LACSI|nr:unnamed protein product [Lactuca saligna]